MRSDTALPPPSPPPPPASLLLSPSAAMGTGWSTSGCWRQVVSTASGTSPFAPSTAWWTSTEAIASLWRCWCTSGSHPRPQVCRPSLDTTRTPTRTGAAPRSVCPQPAASLPPPTLRGRAPAASWRPVWGYEER